MNKRFSVFDKMGDDPRSPACDYIFYRAYDNGFVFGSHDGEIGDWGKPNSESELLRAANQLVAHHEYEAKFYKLFAKLVAKHGMIKIESILARASALRAIERDYLWMKKNKNGRDVQGAHYQQLQVRGMKSVQEEYDRAHSSLSKAEHAILGQLKEYFAYYGL